MSVTFKGKDSTYTSDTYVASATIDGNSFRSPRQKTWGIFIKYGGGGGSSIPVDAWKLVTISQDITLIKKIVNNFLQYPPKTSISGSDAKPENIGINAVIATEILPIDSLSKLS